MLQRDAEVIPGDGVAGCDRDERLELLLGIGPPLVRERNAGTGAIEVGAILEGQG